MKDIKLTSVICNPLLVVDNSGGKKEISFQREADMKIFSFLLLALLEPWVE